MCKNSESANQSKTLTKPAADDQRDTRSAQETARQPGLKVMTGTRAGRGGQASARAHARATNHGQVVVRSCSRSGALGGPTRARDRGNNHNTCLARTRVAA